MVGDALVEAVWGGGYPVALARTAPRRRTAWAKPYLEALVQRDMRDVTGIDRLEPLPRLLRALAQIAGQMCKYNQLGGQVGLEHKTAARYVGVFEQMYRSWRLEPQPAVLKVAI